MAHGSDMKIGDAEPSSDYPAPLIQTPSVAVISSTFCAPYPVELIMVREDVWRTNGSFSVKDVNGNTVFNVRSKFLGSHRGRVLLDAAGNPLITLQEKILSSYGRWKVFRGDSETSKDPIFSAKRSSIFQWKTKFNVFLATNIMEEFSDFTLKGSWFNRSCTIYSGNSNNVVAQMHNKSSAASLLRGKDTFTVTVYPNVDYAFVVALIVILDAINQGSAE